MIYLQMIYLQVICPACEHLCLTPFFLVLTAVSYQHVREYRDRLVFMLLSKRSLYFRPGCIHFVPRVRLVFFFFFCWCVLSCLVACTCLRVYNTAFFFRVRMYRKYRKKPPNVEIIRSQERTVAVKCSEAVKKTRDCLLSSPVLDLRPLCASWYFAYPPPKCMEKL